MQFLPGNGRQYIVQVESQPGPLRDPSVAVAGRQILVAECPIGRDAIEEEIELGRLVAIVGDHPVGRQGGDGEIGAKCLRDITVDQRVVDQVLQQLCDGGDCQHIAHDRPPRR